MASLDERYWRRHLRSMSEGGSRIDSLFDDAISKLARIFAGVDLPDNSKPFSFSDYPALTKRASKAISVLADSLTSVVLNGIDSEWTLANNKNSELAKVVFGENIGKLSTRQYERYFTDNQPALEAFRKRKEGGLGISDRVWKYAGQFKEEIEMGIDLGIRDRLPAAEMASNLKRYLREPDRLFRRVRNEHGQLRLSKAAASYHPGRGVYRSSYMNARRLAATENNIAYHTADYLRWQGFEFVVGIEVGLSNNHPAPDMCDDLAGIYPKDFKFTGWHPHCRCHATMVLKTDEEIAEDTRRIMRGEEPLPASSSRNYVSDVPKGFKTWVKENSDRIERAKSLPYFIRDNKKAVDVILKKVPENYSVVKEYGNGGRVLVHDLVSHKDNDYEDLVSIGDHFAMQGRVVKLTPKMTRPPKFNYCDVYGSLVGTQYEGKCPDLSIDDSWYEFEGFVTDNPKRAFRNMLNNGLSQSNRLIIKQPQLTDAYMKRIVNQRRKNGERIYEIWLKEGRKMRLLYKKLEE